jgi:GNAT superfamily N-acetyltransferase
VVIRTAQSDEIEALARLWHSGWRDAHEAILPPELARDRTIERFAERLACAAREDVRVAGPLRAPLGFYFLKGEELYQLYVAAEARGTGLAAALIGDAESVLRGRGVRTASLDCAIGNDRAARFYEKAGWERRGRVVSRLDTASGPFALEVWRYEKNLAPVSAPGP